MPRTGPEIDAEAQCLRLDAQSVIDAAEARLVAAKKGVATAVATAKSAQNSLDQIPTAGDLDDAEGHCTVARTHLSNARVLAEDAFAGVVGGDPKDEWKECRVSIDRFDKILVDLRKTGFGFITALVGASALLIATTASRPPPELQFFAFAIIGLLIITLYGIDRKHQVWLNTSVKRAMALELRLNYRITQDISDKFNKFEAFFIGIFLYLTLLVMTTGIFWAALEGSARYQPWILYGGLSALVVIIAVGVSSWLRERRSSSKR
jgi:hypothetical protein